LNNKIIYNLSPELFAKEDNILNFNERLATAKIEIPETPPKGGIYTQAKEFGEGLVYLSGCGPDINGNTFKRGRVGSDLTFEEGQEAAKNCALNLLAVLKSAVGDLDRVKSFVKLLVLVSSDNGFYRQPETANAASQLLIDLFGDEIGCAARSAIGVNVLPDNIPVEIEAIVELKSK